MSEQYGLDEATFEWLQATVSTSELFAEVQNRRTDSVGRVVRLGGVFSGSRPIDGVEAALNDQWPDSQHVVDPAVEAAAEAERARRAEVLSRAFDTQLEALWRGIIQARTVRNPNRTPNLLPGDFLELSAASRPEL